MCLRAAIPLCLSLTFSLVFARVLAAETPNPIPHIPDVHGVSLANEKINLPEALKGKVGVLVLGFSRNSRDAVAKWGKRLAADYRESPIVVYYEMPVLAAVPRAIRGFVIRSIQSSVPAVAQARFMPILEDEAAWKAISRYEQADDPYLLVVEGQGGVVWRVRGEATDGAYADLKQHVEALRARIATPSTK